MVKEKRIYKAELYVGDVETSLNDRRIFGGVLEYDLDWSNIRYSWSRNLFDMMRGNTWFTEHVTLPNEKKDYNSLSPDVRNAYDMALAQIVFMDSFQQRNIASNLYPYITAPEVASLLTRQSWEELEHTNSYSTLIDTISDDSSMIYKKHLNDKFLHTKNNVILDTFNKLDKNNEPTVVDAIEACFANLALEGVYFYSAFSLFWTIARSGKMRGTSEMISYIARDEVTHLLLFKNIITSTRKDYPEYFTQDYIKRYVKILTDAASMEIKWGTEITKGNVAGLTPEMIKYFVQYLVNDIVGHFKFELPYEKTEHPMPWVKETMKFNHIKTSMFEGTNRNYNKVGLLDDF